MRRYWAVLLGALGFVGLLVWLLWPSRAQVALDLSPIAQQLTTGSGPSDRMPGAASGGSGATPSVPELSDADAEFLNQARSLFQQLPLTQGSASRVPDDELTRDLFREAAKRGRPADDRERLGRSSVGERPPGSLSPEERLARVRQLEAGVHEIAERVALARADRALERVAKAEAELTVVHRDLTRLTGGRALVPSDPLCLLTPEQLRTAADATAADLRALKTREALFPSPEATLRRRAAERAQERLRAVQADPDYARFHAGGKGFAELDKHITKKQWDAARLDHTPRVAAELKRLQAEAACIPSQRELLRIAHQVRGPPADGPGRVLFEATRFYDADAGQSARNEARLRAAADALDRIDLPEEHPARRLHGRARVLAFLGNDDLHHLQRLTRIQEQAAREARAAGVVSPERAVYTREMNEAVAREVARRESTGDWEPLKHAAAESTIREHLGPPDGPLNRAAGAQLLAVAQERFPDFGTMPKAVADEARSRIAAAAKGQIDRLHETAAGYRAVSERVGQSTAPVDENQGRALRNQREALTKATEAAGEYARSAESKGVVLDAAVRRRLALLEATFRGPEPPAPGPPGEPPAAPPKGPSGPGGTGSGGGRLLATDPRFEKHLTEAQAHGRALTDLAGVDTAAPRFGTQTGRFSITESDLTPQTALDQKFRADANTKPRLPGNHAEWKGRLTPSGEPFDFQKDVKEFRSFDPVGGGIHFGETAEMKGERDLSLAVLGYDAARKQLLLIGPGGKDVFRLDGIEPDVLKALYRFVLAKRNAAISIGWGLERPTALEREALGNASAVLLDPYLVDTRVGQDLVLADTIPWALDTKPIIKGKPVSFCAEFKGAHDEFYRTCGKNLGPVLARVEPFAAADAGRWFERLGGDRAPMSFVRAMLKCETAEDATAWYADDAAPAIIRAQLNGLLKREKLPEIAGTTEKELQAGLRRFRERLHLKAEKLASRHDLTPAGQRALDEILDEEVPAIYKKMHTGTVEALKKDGRELFAFFGRNREAALARAVDLTLDAQLARDGAPEALVELWAALVLTRTPEDRRERLRGELANYLAARQTSLAVLIDDPTTVELADGQIRLSGKMRYRYATSRVVVKDGRVYAGKVPGEDNEVETIRSLTDLANENWKELSEGFEPLTRVAAYARLAAFLRWAVAAKAAGRLGDIDLSALATTPAHDRKRFPTPDEIRRDRRPDPAAAPVPRDGPAPSGPRPPVAPPPRAVPPRDRRARR